jgi:hypothetical protein
MSQAAPGGTGTTDASARLNLEIEGMKQRAGVGCEVTGISTCDDKRFIFIGTAHVSKVIHTDCPSALLLNAFLPYDSPAK